MKEKKYNAIILAVAHNEFLKINLNKLKEKNCFVYDVKGVLNNNQIDKRLWCTKKNIIQ